MVADKVAPRQSRSLVPKPSQYRLFVLHHTHWDREWWTTFQDLRIQLVEVIDELLDTLDRDPQFHSFLLDGQTVILRDYLEIRPENRDRLATHVRVGRIECGPWYVLPDEFLVSGEAHIRNLWLGRKVGIDLDIPLLQAGYIPDLFGHIGQMPQILAGFGIHTAFLWRGRGGDPETVKGEFLWEAPDGTSLVTHWFPHGYYHMPFLHFGNPDRPDADKLGRIHSSISDFSARATTDILLVPYGGDHRPIDPHLALKIEHVNGAIEGLGVATWSTLERYIDAIASAGPALELVRGEIRGSGPFHPHLLSGVLSARMPLKDLNFWGQTWLERYAEPFSALAWVQGRRYDGSLLWKAWEYLVQNHPHDSICGCSIDQVHREMIPRFAQSRQIAEIVAAKSAQHLNASIDTAGLDPEDRALVVRNPLPEPRTDWASVWIEPSPIDPHTHTLLDPDGREIPFQVREVEESLPMTERWRHTEIGFVADAVPGLGYRMYRLQPRTLPIDRKQRMFSSSLPVAAGKGSASVSDLRVGSLTLENHRIRVEVDHPTGALTVTDRVSGHVYPDLNTFEDGGDAGDSYTYSAPLCDTLLHSDEAEAHVSLVESGYARATLRIDRVWKLPVGLTPDRMSRSPTYVEYHLSSFVSLMAGCRRVEITTEWNNNAADHRLRVLFPLGARPTHSSARGQFEVVHRPVGLRDTGNGWPETAAATMPHQGWVSVEHGGRGLTVAARGLPEFEALDDRAGTLSFTLVRAVGWVSREDILAREDGAGPQTPAPDAQCMTRLRAQYAIIPHAGDWLGSGAFRAAEAYLTPFYGSVSDRHHAAGPSQAGFIRLHGDHTLVLSACKKSEHGEALILRFWNVAGVPTVARVFLDSKPRGARLVDLKEEPVGGGSLPIDDDGAVVLSAGPHAIVTLEVRL